MTTNRAKWVGSKVIERAVLPWLLAAIAAALLLAFRPFPGDLDRGSILAIAGLMLATVAVTFGLVAVLAQHLSETYSRALVQALDRSSIWRSAVIGEAVAVMGVVAIALWRADLTSGSVAAVLLVASLLESWFAVTQLLRQFDPVSLIHALKEVALVAIQRKTDNAPIAVRQSQAVLTLLLQGSRKGDVEVVTEGMAAWNAILDKYLLLSDIVWYDAFLYWLYPRCAELIEQYAKESVGLVLPVVVDGVTSLGQTTASYRNPVNSEFDEGTAFFSDALKTAVMVSGRSQRSTAAEAAAQGLGSIGMACINAKKLATLGIPIDTLSEIGIAAAEPAVHVTSRAAMELAKIVITLARSDLPDVMCGADAESALKGRYKALC